MRTYTRSVSCLFATFALGGWTLVVGCGDSEDVIPVDGDASLPQSDGGVSDVSADRSFVSDAQADQELTNEDARVGDAASDVQAEGSPVVDAGPPVFKTVKIAEVDGPAFVSVGDINKDNKPDIVVSAFGKIGMTGVPDGQVIAYLQGATLNDWTAVPVITEKDGYKFPNATSLEDVDGDGDLDIFLPAGFMACTSVPLGRACGGLAWVENQNPKFIVHRIVDKGSDLFYHHVEYVDFDGDTVKDIVTTGEESKKAPITGQVTQQAVVQWFKGKLAQNLDDLFDAKEVKKIGDGLGSFPRVHDVDGDGDLDIVSAEFFVKDGSFAWMERKQDGTFTRHVINDNSGPSIMLSLVPNLYGDNVLKAIGANHTNTAKTDPDAWESALFVFDIPADPKTPWTKTKITTDLKSDSKAGMGAPGIFDTGDIDGDKDMDILVAGDGDPRVLWLEQTEKGKFVTHVLEEKLKQAGGIRVVDLNGDGKNELVVTGYEDNVVRLYTRQ